MGKLVLLCFALLAMTLVMADTADTVDTVDIANTADTADTVNKEDTADTADTAIACKGKNGLCLTDDECCSNICKKGKCKKDPNAIPPEWVMNMKTSMMGARMPPWMWPGWGAPSGVAAPSGGVPEGPGAGWGAPWKPWGWGPWGTWPPQVPSGAKGSADAGKE